MSGLVLRDLARKSVSKTVSQASPVGSNAVLAYAVGQPAFVNTIAVKAPKVTLAAVTPKLRLVKAETSTKTKSQWHSYIQDDAQGLLRALQRLVNSHPLVRSALKGQAAAAGTSQMYSVQDLANELYLLLLQKDRFRHYVDSAMTDADIEREIFQVELTNHLISILRRCRPENYRMVRRIGMVLESDARFKVMGGDGSVARYRQSPGTLYGLVQWESDKNVPDGHVAMLALAQVPMRTRDLRRAGCSGETQLIVSNQGLAILLLEILQAINGPVPLRDLRQFALSKLPVWDVTLTPIETDIDDDRMGGIKAEAIPSTEVSPEEELAQQEEINLAHCAARHLLTRLHTLTKENAVRTERLCRVLWHCYFDPTEPSQLAIAEMVGVSDSSVGDYRRKLEVELRRTSLSFTQVSHFSDALRKELKDRLFREPAPQAVGQCSNKKTLTPISLPVAMSLPALA